MSDTDTDTDASPLVNTDRVTNICTERRGFAVDEEAPRSESAEPPEGN
ncbi:hypothetical protein M0R89_00435 [Halorussus limi]|uniref:Uncharacterized protein n=1 Tax=Halorussus limi TaxID=2938695 RepID=A0A8U0HTY6_9EURY|nr:hypothetical protein [Halorussus limi]UPV74552.1 hypothetical protein M0R89_00435 [Halorussus limi]